MLGLPDGIEGEAQYMRVAIDEQSQVNMRAAPAMDAEIIAMLPDGAEVEVLAEEDGWAYVAHGGREGYILGGFSDVTVWEPGRSDLRDARVLIWTDASDETTFGDTVSIRCEIENLYGWDYTLQWQQEDESGQWLDIPGARDISYSFPWTEENYASKWRVKVDIIVPEGDSSD